MSESAVVADCLGHAPTGGTVADRDDTRASGPWSGRTHYDVVEANGGALGAVGRRGEGGGYLG